LVIDWLKECLMGGKELFHSSEKFEFLMEIINRLCDDDSHSRYINRIIEMIEMYDPIEDTMFHEMNASG